MKKVFRLENLDCANCAAKMEGAIKKVDGVEDATVNFIIIAGANLHVVAALLPL